MSVILTMEAVNKSVRIYIPRSYIMCTCEEGYSLAENGIGSNGEQLYQRVGRLSM